MTLDGLIFAFKSVTYKPNVKLELTVLDEKHVQFRIIFRTLCSKKNQPTEITHNYIISDLEFKRFTNEAHFFHFLRFRIHMAEMHEADEFLKIDGKLLVDPHETKD